MKPGNENPSGWAWMRQNWDKLLFLHWPVEEQVLRPLIPSGLAIDLFDGCAWIGVVPFTMHGVRPSFLPPIPWVSSAHELNVRTYVKANGKPGVWFLSMDASSRLVVEAARMAYFLPYFTARMRLEEKNGEIHYSSNRTDTRAAPAHFEAIWKIEGALPETRPGSLDFFLTERYCLYAERGGTLYQARILHEQWPLAQARLISISSTLLSSLGIESPSAPPLIHAQREPVGVSIWPLEKLP
jgi:uncharacterized protein